MSVKSESAGGQGTKEPEPRKSGAQKPGARGLGLNLVLIASNFVFKRLKWAR